MGGGLKLRYSTVAPAWGGTGVQGGDWGGGRLEAKIQHCSTYTVRGQHLRGIEIVAPAMQISWQGSQIVYTIGSQAIRT